MPLDDMGRVQLDLLRARHAGWGGDSRAAPELYFRAARGLARLAPGDAGLAYLQAITSAALVGGSGTGADTRDIALAALECPMPPEPAAIDWLVVGLA